MAVLCRFLSSPCHWARQEGYVLKPRSFEPGLNLRVRLFPLVMGGVPVEGIEHTPLGIGMHGDFGQEPQRVEDWNAVYIVERNRYVAKRVEPSAREAGGEEPLKAARSFHYPIQPRGDPGNELLPSRWNLIVNILGEHFVHPLREVLERLGQTATGVDPDGRLALRL